MDLIQVDMIGLQTPQAVLARLDDIEARVAPGIRVGIVHFAVALGRQENTVALAAVFERNPGDGLRFAASVDIGGIDKIAALLQEVVNH